MVLVNGEYKMVVNLVDLQLTKGVSMPRIQSNFKPMIDQTVQVLSNQEYGKYFSYEDLDRIANMSFKVIAGSVKSQLLKNYNRLLVNVRNRGYQISKLDDVHVHSAHHRKKASNQFKKSLKICQYTDLNEMSESSKNKLFQEAAKSSAAMAVIKLTEKQSKLPSRQICLPSNEQIIAMFVNRT